MTRLPTKEETRATLEKLRSQGLFSVQVEARSVSTIKKQYYQERLSATRGGPKSDTGGGAEPPPTVQSSGRFYVPPIKHKFTQQPTKIHSPA